MNLQHKLLAWFDKHARPLPWRKHYRPYEVWVSEIMLQQTQVDTALPYFERWFKTFPTIESLAAADEKKVLKMWEGLGYYSRARNLHHTAKRIVEKHGGRFPEDFETILSLKGIGRYSAGAITSIAFNQNRPIVDGNVLRVLSRVYAIKDPVDVEANKTRFWRLQEELIPAGKARWFNQALMELGALVCKKEAPLCQDCPVSRFCQAHSRGNPHEYPVKQNKKKLVRVEAAALVLKKNGRYLIQRRPLGKIMGGLWEFPEWKLAREKKLSAAQIKAGARKNAEKELGPGLRMGKQLGIIKRNYTHHLEKLHVFESAAQGPLKGPSNGWRRVWASEKEFTRYPFSSAHLKITKLL